MSKEFDIPLFVREGWAIFRKNIGGLVIVAFVYFLINMMVAILPLIGSLISLAITGPLMGGVFLVALDTADDRKSDVKRIFAGFDQFKPFFLVYLLSTLFIAIAVVAVLIPIVIVAAVVGGFGLMEVNPDDPPVALLLLIPLAVIPALVVSSWYLFVYVDVASARVGFWEAMERSRKTIMASQIKGILFMFTLGIIMMAGILCFGIGILFAFPLCCCIQVAAYRHLYDGVALSGSSPGVTNPLASAPPPLASGADAGGVTTPPPLAASGEETHYELCLVLVENHEPDDGTMRKIVANGAPAALTQEPAAQLVPMAVSPWPEREELSGFVKKSLRNYVMRHPDGPDYSDARRYRLHVWKGRDKSSRKNMAVVSITRQT